MKKVESASLLSSLVAKIAIPVLLCICLTSSAFLSQLPPWSLSFRHWNHNHLSCHHNKHTNCHQSIDVYFLSGQFLGSLHHVMYGCEKPWNVVSCKRLSSIQVSQMFYYSYHLEVCNQCSIRILIYKQCIW